LNFRITMEYGGSDVTRCFHWLLQRSGFNPKEIDLNKITDCLIMQEMKESYCHLDQVNKRVFLSVGGGSECFFNFTFFPHPMRS
jgi:hypothetical protein